MRKPLLLGFVLLSVAGCQHHQASTANVNFQPTDIDKQMYRSVEEIQKSLRILAEVKNAEAQQTMTYEQRQQSRMTATAMPYGMDKNVTMNWHGEAENALKMLASLTGYQFPAPLGAKPKEGVIVNISATNRPAYDVLRDIGSQAGQRATVRLVPNTASRLYGVIELEYKR